MPVLYCHVMDTFSQKSEPNLDLFICYLNWMRVAWFVLLCELNHCACWRIEFSSLILTECYGASDLLTFLVFACLWTNADHLCVIASMRYGRMLYCMCVSYTCWLLRRTKRWIICTAEMWDSESLAADVEKTLAMQDEDIHRECRMTVFIRMK